MKKITALILVLALCLGLTACASEDEKAYEAANALLEAGDYEGALDAYQSIPLYQQIRAKIQEAEEHSITSRIAPYVGIWKDLLSNTVITINPDGTYHASNEYTSSDNTVFFDGDYMYVYDKVMPKEIDGILHLVGDYSDYVLADAYETLGAKTIAITMDNWQTYFELKEARDVTTNDFGEVTSVSYGYGIFLREEYEDKLFDEYSAVDVTFKITYDEVSRYIVGDYPNGEFGLGEEFKLQWHDYKTQEANSSVYHINYKGNDMSDFNERYVANFANGYVYDWNTPIYANVPTNVKVTAVIGTLKLFP